MYPRQPECDPFNYFCYDVIDCLAYCVAGLQASALGYVTGSKRAVCPSKRRRLHTAGGFLLSWATIATRCGLSPLSYHASAWLYFWFHCPSGPWFRSCFSHGQYHGCVSTGLFLGVSFFCAFCPKDQGIALLTMMPRLRTAKAKTHAELLRSSLQL
jgi:hypothetical protein